jgi:hypothetical protein
MGSFHHNVACQKQTNGGLRRVRWMLNFNEPHGMPWLERLLCAGLFQTHGEKTLRDSMLSGEGTLGEPA